MDVAIRTVNWVVAYHFFHKRMDEDFRKKFLQGLFLHGRFIRFNLEYGRMRNNHYYSDVVGLVWLGLFFRGRARSTYQHKVLRDEMPYLITVSTNATISNFAFKESEMTERFEIVEAGDNTSWCAR